MNPLSAIRFDARLAVALGAALAAFAVTAFAPQVLNDGDTFLHIAAGQRMLADRAVLYSDPFSFTFAGKPWQAHEWLAEIVMALAYQAGGWSGLIGLFAVAAALTAGVLAFTLGRWLAPLAQLVVSVLALSCMTGSLLARPHLLALPLLAVWTAELVAARGDNRRPALWLVPLMCVWTNIHGSFLLGLALGAALGLEALIDNPAARWRTFGQWAVFGLGAVVATLINPHFIAGATFPLTLMGTPSLANIDEWQATDFSQLQPIEFVVLAALYVVFSRGVKIAPLRALLLLGLLHMALQHQRHQIVFAVVAPLLLAEPLGRAFGEAKSTAKGWLSAAAAATAALAIVVLAAVRLTLPIMRGDAPVAPMTALAHVPQALRAAPVLNDYSFGGYLIFSGVRPFIDSRAELYGETALRDYAALIQPDAAALDRALRFHAIRWSILSPQSPIVAELARKGWRLAYADAFAIVQIRDKARR